MHSSVSAWCQPCHSRHPGQAGIRAATLKCPIPAVRPCPRVPRVACHARKRTFYDVLEIDVDASSDEVKAAFRRKAKEVHPDVSDESDAEAQFIEVSQAYETLSDEAKRAQYDQLHGVRRMNFFRDVEETSSWGGGLGSSFRWGNVGSRPGAGAGRAASSAGQRRRAEQAFYDNDDNKEDDIFADPPDEDAEDSEDEDEGSTAGTRSTDDDHAAGTSGRDSDQEPDPQRMLEELAKLMGGAGGLRRPPWVTTPGGRDDPWGQSTTDRWRRQVDEQARQPFARPGSGGMDWRREEVDWGRRSPPGWTPPGRGSEWSHPRRGWEEQDRGSGGPGPAPGRGSPGGNPFRGPFSTGR